MSGEQDSGFLSGYKCDYYGGALMVLIGLVAIIQGMSYQIGTLTNMRPGFFPVSVGSILIFLGVAIAGTAKRPVQSETAFEQTSPTEYRGPEWRGWICILGGVVAFPILGKWGGLLIATFAITFISALGDRDNTWRTALALALLMSLISVVIFWWALQIQFPLLNWG